MKSVFISRDLKRESIFRQLLEQQGFEVFGMSLIAFKAVDFNLPEKPDWLFFYSKNGVRFFLEKGGLDYLKNVKIGTVGEGTAAFLKSKNLTPDFIGNGEPKETAREFSKVASGCKVVFVRAKTSSKSVQGLLNDSIVVDLVVYENQPKLIIEIGDFGVLVFTSSMNAETYFANKRLLNYQQVAAIGSTTAATLEKLGIKDFFMAKTPTEEGLANAVLEKIKR